MLCFDYHGLPRLVYLLLVMPILKYAHQVSQPHLRRDITLIERVARCDQVCEGVTCGVGQVVSGTKPRKANAVIFKSREKQHKHTGLRNNNFRRKRKALTTGVTRKTHLIKPPRRRHYAGSMLGFFGSCPLEGEEFLKQRIKR